MNKPLTLEFITSLMDKEYVLVVWENDSLNDNLNIIQECIEQKSKEPLDDFIYENTWAVRQASVYDIVNELKFKCENLDYSSEEIERFFNEYEGRIEENIYDREKNSYTENLLKHHEMIPVRIDLCSNFDCINSHYVESYSGYSCKDVYMNDMIDALILNPVKVKQKLLVNDIKTVGEWQDIESRNGNELVDYDDFIQELIDSCSGANHLIYLGMVKLIDLYHADFNLKKVVVPKGNRCGLFSTDQGGGSPLDMRLDNDVTISLEQKHYPFFRFWIDAENTYGYSVNQVYGVMDSFYEKELTIVSDQVTIPLN